MSSETKSRADLKQYFVKNAIPTEGQFADLIDASINQKDDGVRKREGQALAVEAVDGQTGRPALDLYSSLDEGAPVFSLELDPRSAPGEDSRPGFAVSEESKARFFIEQGTGQIGVGILAPSAALHVVPTENSNANESSNANELLVLGYAGGENLKLNRKEITARKGNQASMLYLQPGGGAVTFQANTSHPIMITAGGDVGIGTASPGATFDVRGDLSIRPAAGQPPLRVTNEGHVGIGTETPQAALDVHGDVFIRGEKPMVLERFSNLANDASTDTSYSAQDWVGTVAGFAAKDGNIEQSGAGDIIDVFLFEKDGTWWIRHNFKTHETHESWYVDALFIRRELVSTSTTFAEI